MDCHSEGHSRAQHMLEMGNAMGCICRLLSVMVFYDAAGDCEMQEPVPVCLLVVSRHCFSYSSMHEPAIAELSCIKCPERDALTQF